ncbi:FeoA family protein [Paenibacillus sp. HB172176]|uniref:FeoA family protein n=1 Tax=Paenibacillus sp. HB172176 TaxID=2493690 RepID=UPI00143C40E4|nr:FeoA family protein [Paenibacillus sp. HB172176]
MSETALSPLSAFKTGQRVQLVKSEVDGVLRRRLMDLGFVPGATVEVLQRSPLGDPVAYLVNQTTIALRKEEGDRLFGKLKEEQ